MMKIINRLFCFLIVVAFSGCAILESGFENPSVKIESVTPTQNTGLEQQFDVGLRVANPNGFALNLLGMTYAIELDGFKIIRGSASNIPGIAAHGNELVTIQASIGLFEGLKFLNALRSKGTSELSYKLSAGLDTGLPIIGVLPVSDSGTVNLSDLQK